MVFLSSPFTTKERLMKIIDQKKWDEYVASHRTQEGREIITHALCLATLLEKHIENGGTINTYSIGKASKEVQTVHSFLPISDHYEAISILVSTWEWGKQLEEWWYLKPQKEQETNQQEDPTDLSL